MCGITGFWTPAAHQPTEQLQAQLLAMLHQLRHRGPDDEGAWVEAASGIGLGMRRLAIIDLSEKGHQPMFSADGRYVIVFNGEIYNYQALRAQVGDYPYQGASDTEVLLAAIQNWGLCRAVQACNGMFAFALWDRQENSLSLARDHMGQKPLYYGWQGDSFLFGSELKALRAHPAFQGRLHREVLPHYLQQGVIPHPYSIYEGIAQLPPAHLLTLHAGERHPQPQPYWSLAEVAAAGQAQPFAGDDTAAISALDGLLREAVGACMVADVPLGAFLSGGVDSSTVVALMQAQSAQPIKTFTIGFHEQAYDEAADAGRVAAHLGTDHHSLYLSEADALTVIPHLPTLYDEPFADSSQIPTFLVAQLARQQVTVSLSGDGGDELFGGYNRHRWGQRLWDGLGGLPRPLRGLLGAGLNALPPAAWDRLTLGRVRQAGDKAQKVAALLQAHSPQDAYQRITAQWQQPPLVGGAAPLPLPPSPGLSFSEDMMLLDALHYLPDDILTKVDRASMGVSLEARVPLLDHRVAAFAWALPLHMKIRGGQGKWLLRQVLYQYVPREFVERPKMGFAVPIGRWLRGELRDWAEALLDPVRLHQEGYLQVAPIRRKWQEHLSGRRNWQDALWGVLMFQAWLEAQQGD